MIPMLHIETISLWMALIGYSLVCAMVMIDLVFRKRSEKFIFGLMLTAVVLHALAIGLRWVRIDHVPLGNTFELLSGNVLGLMLAVVVGYWRLPGMRAFAAVVMPVVMMMMAWMLLKPAAESSLPPTYYTIWLYIHVVFIKLFVGCAFISLGLSGVILLRHAGLGGRFSGLSDAAALDGRAYRFMALGLIFDSLGIVAGAIWAQNAWGRYWSWDTLETWSLATWFLAVLSLHVRVPFKTSPVTNAWLIVAVFVCAFFTFFGIPFVSTALHKGQI